MIKTEFALTIALSCVSALVLVAVGLTMAKQYLPPHFLAAIKNERSNHIGSPRQLGGLVIVPVFLFCLVFVSLVLKIPIGSVGLIACGLGLLFVIGLIDDWKGLGITIRFPGQFIACYLLLVGSGVGGEILLVFGLTLVALVYWINVVNFMDGLDLFTVAGLILPLLTMGLILISSSDDSNLFGVVAFIAAAGLAGFASYNFPPASVFLGDSGSLFLGGVSGICALVIGFTISPFLAFLPITYYVLDASTTIILRLLRRENIFRAHSSHAYQRAFRSGKSALLVSISVGLLNLALGTLTILALNQSYPFQLTCLVVGIFLSSMLIIYFRKSDKS